MNLFSVLVILFLFFSKTVLQDYPVWVTCGPEYFHVVMDRDLFRNGILLHPSQVILGRGCQVSIVLEDKFFFFYSIFQCGIRREMKWNMVILRSCLHCNSLENVAGGTCDIPLQCTIQEEHLNRLVIQHVPPPSGRIAGMNVSYRLPSASRPQQDVGPRERASGSQDAGAAALAWNTFPNPTLSLASPVSWGHETCHQAYNSIL